MLIEKLLYLLYSVLDYLLFFELPEFPESVLSVFEMAEEYLSTGVCILTAFLGTNCMYVIGVILQLVIGLYAAYFVYSLVFWVIRKIPMLHVKE